MELVRGSSCWECLSPHAEEEQLLEVLLCRRSPAAAGTSGKSGWYSRRGTPAAAGSVRDRARVRDALLRRLRVDQEQVALREALLQEVLLLAALRDAEVEEA